MSLFLIFITLGPPLLSGLGFYFIKLGLAGLVYEKFY